MTQKFRILSLSGGGIRGVYSASFLAKLEELTGKNVADHFDLIVGTSTGGLIALALGLGQRPESIRDFYLKHGGDIFPRRSKVKKLFRMAQVHRPLHDAKGLMNAVQKRLGTEASLGDSRKRLVVNTFNAATGQPQCFKTRHHGRYMNDWRMPAWEVAMATAAAPVFLRAFESDHGTTYIDGGVWANSPALVGVIEAMSDFKKSADEIEVLSIGTTRAPFSVDPRARKGGVWQNASVLNRRVIDLLMEANRAGAMNMACLLIGKDNIMDVDHIVKPGEFELDDTSSRALRDLKALGEADAKDKALEIRNRFLLEEAEPFTPIAMDAVA